MYKSIKLNFTSQEQFVKEISSDPHTNVQNHLDLLQKIELVGDRTSFFQCPFFVVMIDLMGHLLPHSEISNPSLMFRHPTSIFYIAQAQKI